MQLVQFWAPMAEPTPDHYFDNSTGFQYAITPTIFYKTAVLARTVKTTGVPAYTWRNTSFNASHLVRPAQLHHRYCLSRDWSLISQDVHSPTLHLSYGTVCLQKSCCAIRNIVLKDILRHSCLIAVTRPSDRYLTSAYAAFCRHTWRFINLLIIIIITRKWYNTDLCLQWPTNRKSYDLSNGASFNDLERPLPRVSRSRHFWPWISQKRSEY